MVGDATRKTPSNGLFGQYSLLVHNRLIFINLLGFYAGFHKAYPHFVGITASANIPPPSNLPCTALAMVSREREGWKPT